MGECLRFQRIQCYSNWCILKNHALRLVIGVLSLLLFQSQIFISLSLYFYLLLSPTLNHGSRQNWKVILYTAMVTWVRLQG